VDRPATCVPLDRVNYRHKRTKRGDGAVVPRLGENITFRELAAYFHGK